jgi:hypothetical protein
MEASDCRYGHQSTKFRPILGLESELIPATINTPLLHHALGSSHFDFIDADPMTSSESCSRIDETKNHNISSYAA